MDRIFQRFLENTAADAVALQRKSDVLVIEPLPPFPSSRYRCRFDVPYLRRLPAGTVAIEAGPVTCCIRFPGDYLCSADSRLFIRIAAVQTADFLHPNVLDGIVCLGTAFAPGTPICGVVWQLFEIVTYQDRGCTVDERNALNPEACRLLRAYPGLLATMARPRLYRPRGRGGVES